MNISTNLNKNIEYLKKEIDSDDLITYEFTCGNIKSAVLYIESLSDKELIAKQIVRPLINLKEFNFLEVSNVILTPEQQQVTSLKELIPLLTSGDAIVLFDKEKTSIVISSKKIVKRAVNEAPTSSNLKGPREGFVEDIVSNLSLIRQRFKSTDFSLIKLTVGKRSNTNVGIVFLKNVANKQLVKSIKKRIESLEIDGVVDSSIIIKCIANRKTSLFKEMGTTEKPDILASKMLEGRVGVIVDGSPIVLTAPYVILEDFQTSEDYYTNTYRATFSRLIRLAAVIFAVLLPAIFVSAQLFHLQFIPLEFLLTIVSSIKGIPLSPSVEMLLTLIIFETLNEASIRMPKYVGIAMSVVGALVLGETAVNAGIVSTPTILIVALSGICLYTVPDLSETLSVLRIIFLIVAGSLGGFAVMLLIAMLITYMCSETSFGVAITAPFSPLIINDLQDGFFMGFYSEMKKRPKTIGSANKIRQGNK